MATPNEAQRHRRMLAFGNPMVDLLLHVSTEFVLSRSLVHGEAIHAHIPADARQQLLDEALADPSVIRAAGGSALNSARTIQCLLPSNSTVFVGAVGDDTNGRFLHDESTSQGVEMHLQIVPTMNTSSCVCYITPDNERTLVVHRAAHSHYAINATFLDVLDTVDFVYIVSFVLSSPSRYACALHAATHLRPTQLFCMNLSSVNLLQNPDVVEKLLTLLPATHVLLGNAKEFQALADALGIAATAMPELAHAIVNHPAVPLHGLLVVTDATNPTWVVQKAASQSFPVQFSPSDAPLEVQDTTGAGDAFVGGFFAGMMSDCTVTACVELGHICARRCVQQVGCHIHLTATELRQCHDILEAGKTSKTLSLRAALLGKQVALA